MPKPAPGIKATILPQASVRARVSFAARRAIARWPDLSLPLSAMGTLGRLRFPVSGPVSGLKEGTHGMAATDRPDLTGVGLLRFATLVAAKEAACR